MQFYNISIKVQRPPITSTKLSSHQIIPSLSDFDSKRRTSEASSRKFRLPKKNPKTITMLSMIALGLAGLSAASDPRILQRSTAPASTQCFDPTTQPMNQVSWTKSTSIQHHTDKIRIIMTALRRTRIT